LFPAITVPEAELVTDVDSYRLFSGAFPSISGIGYKMGFSAFIRAVCSIHKVFRIGAEFPEMKLPPRGAARADPGSP
jgi:hypothetical protein